jgi:putative membrane protein insertion efficiency factor
MLKYVTLPFILLIRVYQFTLSPMIGQCCRFEPTCSQYAIDALKKYGLFKGSWLAAKRISRCHPFNDGGYDPVK